MKKMIAGVGILAALATGCAVAEFTPQESPEISGSVRLYQDGWGVISDSAHTPAGFGQIETLSDRVRIYYDFEHCGIRSVQATPDESFSAANVRVGASVGVEYIDLFFYMPRTGQAPINPALLTRANANVWLTGDFAPCSTP